MRLDLYIAERLSLFSRSQARSRIVSLRVNGAPARLGKKLKLGDTISLAWTAAPPPHLLPQEIPLAVIFEKDDVIVVDKPQGMVVHPGSGNPGGTLANALLYHCEGLAQRFGQDDPRPGIVHRLDKETSGVIIAAKNPAAHEHLARQFHDHAVRKTYVALVKGSLPSARGKIDTRIARDPRDRKRFAVVSTGGRQAVTFWHVLRSVNGYSLVSLLPATGRTHQLRVHMLHMRTPILGDPLYARRDPRLPGVTLMLHARKLRITLPGEGEPREFASPLPPRFRDALSVIQSFSPRKGL